MIAADELAAFEGRPAGPERAAPDAVNEAMIRHWCQAMGDANPVYVEPEFARASAFGGIVAPPAMLHAWTMHDRREPPATAGATAEAELMALLQDAGFTGVVATNCEQAYRRPLRPGDRLTARSTILTVRGPKRTALGEGWFVTTETAFHDERDDVVATMLFRVLRHRPPANGRAPRQGPPRPADISPDPMAVVGRSAGSRSTATRAHRDVRAGDRLPELVVPLTPTLIVCGALASRDFNVLHHDRDRAVASGAPDIFMNILTTNGLVGRFVSEWAGPEAQFERIAIRLGAPNYPYDTMRLTGQVEEVDAQRLTVSVRGANGAGDHVTGTVTVRLP